MPRKRKLPDGMWQRGSVYYARFRAHGRLVRKRLSTDYRAACEMLNDLRARADRADFHLLDNDCSIAEIRREYLRHCEQTLRPSTVKRYRENLTSILDGLRVKSVSQITVQGILAYRRDRLSSQTDNQGRTIGGTSPRTVNMDVGALSAMLNWAVEHSYVGSNPLAKVSPLPTESLAKDRRALTIEEVEALFDESPAYLKPVWRMFMVTGIRKSELVNLRFEDVDFEAKCMTVRAYNAKSRKAREIPLDDAMLNMLAGLKRMALGRQPVGHRWCAKQDAQQRGNFSAGHVFVSQANTPLRNNLLTRFYAICKRANIQGAEPGGTVDIHSLRVTFATLSLEHGANPKAVQMILGHSTLEMTMQVYAKATDRTKREAIAALPFASTSTPEHVVSMQDAHTARTSSKNETEGVA